MGWNRAFWCMVILVASVGMCAASAAAAPVPWRVDRGAPFDTGCQFDGVARVPATTTIWAVGDCQGTAIVARRTRRTGWVKKPVGFAGSFSAVSGVSPGDVWAVGTNGQPL